MTTATAHTCDMRDCRHGAEYDEQSPGGTWAYLCSEHRESLYGGAAHRLGRGHATPLPAVVEG